MIQFLRMVRMRILHTSDWHFGKRFLETDMIPQQELFADWIADVVTAEKVDAAVSYTHLTLPTKRIV